MSQLIWEYKVSLLCALASLILCAVLGAEWWYGHQYRAQVLEDILTVKKGSFDMQAVPEYHFSKVPLEAYADFVARPVFFEGRKPIEKYVEPVAAIQPVAEEPKLPLGEFGLVLTGIVKTPKGVISALFKNPNGRTAAEKNKRLAQGDVFNGWTLVDIQKDKVIISAEAEQKELLLLKAKPKVGVMGGGVNPFAPPNLNNAPAPVPSAPMPPPNVNPFNLQH